MERTDWLDQKLNQADARFLMVTAITHHQVSSPIWGEHEVRKLHAELAEIQRTAVKVVVEHKVSLAAARHRDGDGQERVRENPVRLAPRQRAQLPRVRSSRRTS